MMGMLGGVRAERLIGQVLASGGLDNPVSLKATDKLKSLSGAAVPKLIALLGTMRRDDGELLVELLRRLIDKDTLEYCFSALADSDQRVVAGVVSALKGARSFDPNRLLSLFDNPQVPRPAVLTLMSAYTQSLNAEVLLRYAYKLEHNDQALLFRIIDETADEQLIPALISRLDAQNPEMRAQVAGVLSRFHTPAVQQALQQLLTDDAKAVRLAALEGLSQMDSGLDVASLCGLIKDPDMQIQGRAIEALVKLNHPRTVHYLLDPLQDESESARRAAVEVINEIGDAGAIKELLVAIKDSDWWVRSRAADALGKIGGPRVVEAVIALIKDEDEFVRRAAIEIINTTRDQRAFDSLIESINDSDWWVRERAIDALGALGNKKAVPTLIKMLDRSEQDQALCLIVIRALGKLGSDAAIKAIIKQLQAKAPNVQREALQALTGLIDESHADLIASAVNPYMTDSEPAVRQLASEILERINAVYTKGTGSRAQGANHTPVPAVAAFTSSNAQSSGVFAATPQTIDADKLQPGDVLAERYRLIRPIGKGAFGTVFLMEDLMVKEEIILKFLSPHVASDENVIRRFVYELRFARKITHRNVIRIFDMISFGKSSAIAMEYFPSHTLGSELRARKPLPIDRALTIVRDVCAGMQAAHLAGVIHRDLKPSNILIDETGLVKIVDFGVAAAVRDMDTRLTRTGLVIGTPTYMAPEQVLGKNIDVRTDIYSLGVIMYELLTGRPPYSGGDSLGVMYQHVQGNPKAPSALNTQLPLALNAIVLKALSVAPDARFQTMGELVTSLAAFGN